MSAAFSSKLLATESACTMFLQNQYGGHPELWSGKYDWTYGIRCRLADQDQILRVAASLGFYIVGITPENQTTGQLEVIDNKATEIMRITVLSLVCRFRVEYQEDRQLTNPWSFETPLDYLLMIAQTRSGGYHLGSIGRWVLNLQEEYKFSKTKTVAHITSMPHLFQSWRELAYHLKTKRENNNNFQSYFFKEGNYFK